MNISHAKKMRTSDHIDIPIYEFGDSSNPCLIVLPGLTGTVSSYVPILLEPLLVKNYYIIFMDYRAHSPENVHGMSIARLSADLEHIIKTLELNDVTLLGHSIGCGVIWSYVELFGQKNIKKIILLDQSPAIMSMCYDFENFDKETYLMHVNQFYEFTCQLANPATFVDVFNKHFENGFISDESKKKGVLDRWLKEVPKMNHINLMRMMIDTLTRDWRDMLHLIKVPTLVVGGKASMVPWQTQYWVSGQIPNCTLKVLEEEEGGYHAMFLEDAGIKVLVQTLCSFLAIEQ